jgi:eukaryotic-like serine/threonine-protein kinase
MPAPATRDEFLALARQSGLVPGDRLDDFLRRHKGRLPKPPAGLADLFIQEGLLTRFQADQLLAGKWKGFTIGKYKVLERIGAGGMGAVYLCEHEQMRRRVAVKVLPDAAAQDPSIFQRFQREARAGAAIDHPNVVRVYDVDADGKRHFIVMEYVDGQTLHELVAREGPLDVPRACNFIRQAAEGLQHAHETGLIHRDVKPANILVDKQGVVKVLDLGLARFAHDTLDMLTKQYDDNNVLGTADYVAPEQTRDSHDVDVRADVYALGGTFYFVLTGRPPFAEGTVPQKLIWHQTKQPPRIQTLRPELPPGVVAVVEKMMAKRREERYQTPADVARALAPWASPSGSTPAGWDSAAHTPPAGTYAVAAAAASRPNPFKAPAPKPFGDRPVPPGRPRLFARREVRLAFLILLGVAAAVGAAWWIHAQTQLATSGASK